MICKVTETDNSIEFSYSIVRNPQPPPAVSVVSRNAVNGYVYVGDCGAPLGRDECLRMAGWLIQRAREMEKKA